MPTHITPVVPRFGELDPYNHVNHAVYVSYFEAARCVALESIGMALPDLTERDIQIVVTQLEMQFKAPATARDLLQIETEVVEIRRASTRWQQRILRDPSGSGVDGPNANVPGASGPNASGQGASGADASGQQGPAVLVTGTLTAAICDNQGKPCRPPADLMAALEHLRSN